MRRAAVVVAVLLGVLGGVLYWVRRDRTFNGDLPMSEGQNSTAPPRSEVFPTEKATGGHRAALDRMKVRFSREFLARQGADTAASDWFSRWATRGREPYYEQLMAKQGRDPAKEEQVLSRMMDTFGGKEDTSVGEIACSAEFCRVELQGRGGVDLLAKYGRVVSEAVEPKGFNFATHDEPGNAIANFYFGRNDSWGVPNFQALGVGPSNTSSAR